jgi:hypothetical protein
VPQNPEERLRATNRLCVASRESELLRLAAFPVPNAEQRKAAVELLDGRVDWQSMLRAAQIQRVISLVARNLKALPAGRVPSEVARTLGLHALAVRRSNEAFAAELGRLVARFRAAGIEIIVYKGPAVAELYYGDVGLRSFGDLDFLVRRADLGAVRRMLEQDGYEPKETLTEEERIHFEEHGKEYCFVRGPLMVEPHWSLTQPRYPLAIDYEGLWQRSRLHEMFGAQLRVFAAEDQLLILCVCGAKSGWERLQMVCDVAAALGAMPSLDAQACLAHARRLGMLRILLLGCHLASELFDAAVPEPLQRSIAADSAIPRLAKRIATSLLAIPPLPENDEPWRYSSLLMAMRERPADKVTYFIRSTTTPTLLHLQRMPLPTSLHGLYRVLVPVYDYLLVPTWRYASSAVGRMTRRAGL